MTTHPVASGFGRKRLPLIAAAAAVVIAGAIAAWILLRPQDPIPFTTFTLDNGLRVILAEDHSAPTVAVAVTYDVGAKDDPPGREGLAHLFEHMLFNGSLNVGRGEHQYLVTKEGGLPNGQTFIDQTHVWETLPSNQLDLALFLEADRMRSLRLDQARLETERATVIAERQQRVEHAAYGGALDALYATAYDRPNYKKNFIGTDEGLRAITLPEVNDFFRIFYAPNNAVLIVVGDFDPADARKTIENYFRHIPAQPPAPRIDLSENEQTAERRARIEDPFAQVPRTYLAYKIPAGTSKDTEAMAVLAALLYDGASSRLHQKLVKERELAVGVGGALDPRKGPGLMLIVMQPGPDRDENILLKGYDEVVSQLREQGVSDADVERARTRVRLARATAMQLTSQRAMLLGEFEVKFGGAELLNEREQWLEDVTAADVKRVAQEYLKPERRTILSVVRGGTATPTFKSITTPATPSMSAVERLNRAPVSKDVVLVTVPKAKETTLHNGLTLLVAEHERLPLVSVRIEIRGAGSLVGPVNSGIPIATAAMLREGTPSRSSRQIAEEFDAHGVAVTIGQSPDAAIITVQANGLSDTFDAWFPILADVVTNASFPANELTVMKRRLLADWQSRRSTPMTLATEIFDQAIYGPGLARPLQPDEIGAVTSDQLKAWHRERYVPQNTIVSIAGAIDPGAAEARVRESLGTWTKTAFAEPTVSPPPTDRARVFIINRPRSVQTTLLMGVPAVDRAHADQLPLLIASRVLGGGPMSRLFVKLSDERGLTFGAFSQLNAFKHGGDWRSWADINSTRLGEGLDAFVAELRRIAAEPVPEPELDDAKRSVVANFALTLEQLSQVVSYLSTRRVYGLSTDYWEQFPEKLTAISAADVQGAAAQYLDMRRLQVVAVGDAAQLEPLLKPLGEVTMVK